MDVQELPIELELARQKFDRTEARTAASFGYGDTEVGLKITHKFIPKLTEAVRTKLEEQSPKGLRRLMPHLSKLGSEQVSLCILQCGVHCVGLESDLRKVLLALGGALSDECWAAKLTHDKPLLAEKIDRAAKSRGNLAFRKNVARRIASANAFATREWSRHEMIRAGEWALNVLLETLPDAFELQEGDNGTTLVFTDSTWAFIDAVIAEAIEQHPVYVPNAKPPVLWTHWRNCGSPDPRVQARLTLLRSQQKDRASAVRHALRMGSAQASLDGLNALQSVAWKINVRVLGVLQACADRGIAVKGLPPRDKIILPERLPAATWASMTDVQRKTHKKKLLRLKRKELSNGCERGMLKEELKTAVQLSEQERFYTPMNMDWRGRVYAICHFNFQREDRVRALFQFADGEPIGEEGLYWLKVHVANTGDFGKISKRPLAERVAWTDANLDKIKAYAELPLQERGWMEADKPFLFLASCFELASAVRVGVEYVTSLPVSFDGSCSGLQHLSAMTRGAEGALVNLTNTPEPQDVYQRVADSVLAKVAADTSDLGKLWHKYMLEHDRRKLVKRGTMTFAYSSKAFGMAQQLDEDFIEPLNDAVATGEIDEHPLSYFGQKKHPDQPTSAALFLAKILYASIVEQVAKPAEAMTFLRKLAQAMAHEAKPLKWVTPAGLPWINRYHVPKTQRLKLFLHDKGVPRRYDTTIAVGDEAEIWKEKAANAVSPNFVHALDACHLLLVARAAAGEGVAQLATVHDSFGCLASRAGRFRQIIREQFVAMYENHDVLTEVLEAAKHDLTQANWHRLPEVPTRGPLNLGEILNADYAFA